MHAAGVAIIVILLLLVAAGVGWIVFTRMRAQRLGLPPPPLSSYLPFVKSSSSAYGPPTPAPGGIVGWFNDRVRAFKNRNNRTATGAYEGSSSAADPTNPRGGRGFGPLDPDDAWDARVGHEPDPYYGAGSGPGGYYEEQELGTHPAYGAQATSGTRGGEGYQMNLPYDEDDEQRTRGRPRSRSPAPPGGLAPAAKNPFGEGAEPSNLSMRGVSPRPIDTGVGLGPGKGKKEDDSPSERRSVFREGV